MIQRQETDNHYYWEGDHYRITLNKGRARNPAVTNLRDYLLLERKGKDYLGEPTWQPEVFDCDTMGARVLADMLDIENIPRGVAPQDTSD